ncbi:biotin--[acetyl-CoA-carboxylase] ligase [Robiginitalea sp. M366]|uniref:biotin--[acetyl-CoA-carboxylase] ligase n=1 Tax=Robiginitalea aestuariiviva TaxID=3036903 RepID=UPI00240D4BD3|nr:biotin--[acetyl-CoA-carboxylase] ligase [Robiginitalea aestuariiviva]MDG1570742.1 biotin--[acetyl-CoA-carboxylase] ligase [Robiginitalea aestuariiviva]
MRPLSLIKISATDSTNAHLKRLLAEGPVINGTLLWAELQTAGRGQRGATWVSEAGKNLTFSLLKSGLNWDAQAHFQLNMAVSLGICQALEAFGIPQLSIKWPNDILSGRHKICGILIENLLQGGRITTTVIGVGLNVNQTEFEALPRAGSLLLATGRTFDREPLLRAVVAGIEQEIAALGVRRTETLEKRYRERLFGLGKSHRYRLPGGKAFRGVIQGVTQDGLLQLQDAGGDLQIFGPKEVEMLY